jgi:hypothetical protein
MSSKENPIKNIFIGNVTLKQKVAEVSYSKTTFQNEIMKIFQKISNSGTFQVGMNNKLLANNENCFYFTLCSNNIFYLIVTDKSYPEYEAFRMIDFIHEKNIFTQTNENGELTKEGISNLKNAIEDYNKLDTSGKIISEMNGDIRDIKDTMKNNLKEVLRTTDDAKSLENMSNNIKLGALEYQDNAKELKKVTCIQNWKWTLIIAGIVIILLVVILVPILT